VSRSIPRGEQPCRKIVFKIKSRDQGWGGDPTDRGTFQGTFSWFDVGVERFEAIDVSRSSNLTTRPLEVISPFIRDPDNRGNASPTISWDITPILPPIDPGTGDKRTYGFKHPFLPMGTRLQSNLTATKEVQDHVITWRFNDAIDPDSPQGDELEKAGRGRATGTGKLVRSLRVGDIVTVWARARFPGWRNQVERVEMDVYWAV